MTTPSKPSAPSLPPAPSSPAEVSQRRPYQPPQLAQLAEAGLQQAGLVWLRVSGASMLPLLRAGDRVELLPVAPERLRRGDLLVFRQGEHLIVHRLVARRGASWIARGDNLSAADPPIPAAAILGRVRRVEGVARSIDLGRRPWSLARPVLGWLAWARGSGGRRERLLGRLQAVLIHGLLHAATMPAPRV